MDVEDARHFSNALDDSTEPENWEEIVRKAIVEVEPQVTAAAHAKPSIYSGGGGVAFTLLRLAQRGVGSAQQSSGREAVLEEVLRRVSGAEHAFPAKRMTLLEGRAGVFALRVWAHTMRGEGAEARKSAEALGDLSGDAADLEAGECEVLYGRCGFLGAVLFVREALGDPQLLSGCAQELVRQVIVLGKAAAKGGWPLYYSWHDKCYLGGAHGMAGILLTLLQLPTELLQAGEGAAQLVRDTAEKLLAMLFSSGNLPSSEGNEKDKCVHWCHGATGLVPLLLKMADFYKEPKYLELAREAGEVVWVRGLLRCKGPGLCHGIPGNAYAFLALHRQTREIVWLRRAQHFAAFVAQRREELMPLCDRPYSLFEGLAGALCFWADALEASSKAASHLVRFPCYEFA